MRHDQSQDARLVPEAREAPLGPLKRCVLPHQFSTFPVLPFLGVLDDWVEP